MVGILLFNYEFDVNSYINPDITPNYQTNINNTTVKYDASGYCSYVVDGDTLDVDGVGRIRLVGVNAPEVGEPGYQEAKDYVKSKCSWKVCGFRH
jgi:micrococcal nuclease